MDILDTVKNIWSGKSKKAPSLRMDEKSGTWIKSAPLEMKDSVKVGEKISGKSKTVQQNQKAHIEYKKAKGIKVSSGD
jgi:hypothetical protein